MAGSVRDRRFETRRRKALIRVVHRLANILFGRSCGLNMVGVRIEVLHREEELVHPAALAIYVGQIVDPPTRGCEKEEVSVIQRS